MKKTLFAALFTLLLVAASGCSSSPDLLRYASAEDAIIITGTPADVFKNSGWDTKNASKLSTKLRSFFDEASEKVPDCFDFNYALISARISGNEKCVLAAIPLTSVSKFESFVEEESPSLYRTRTERNDMIFYQMDAETNIVINDDVVLMVIAEGNSVQMPDEIINSALKRAADHPLQDWQIDLLEQEKTLNLLISVAAVKEITGPTATLTVGYDPALINDGFVYITGALDGSECQIIGKILTHDGSAIENPLLKKKINTDMLRYATNGSALVAMVAIEPGIDWYTILTQTFSTPAMRRSDVYVDEKTVGVIASVLENISGTVMLSIEPCNISKISSPEGWGITLAAELQPGAAESYVEMLQTLFDAEQFAYIVTDHGFESTFPVGGTLFVRTYGDTFFASTLPPDSPRGKGKYITAADFTDQYGGVAVRMPKGYPLLSLTGLQAGIDMKYFATSTDVTFTTTLTDTDQPLLQAILSLL